MKNTKSMRGFQVVEHEVYPPNGSSDRLVQQSSAIGEYDDAFDRPGSSFLWIGKKHHLNREQVGELVERLQEWLRTGMLYTDRAP